MADVLYKEVSYKIIGACMKVYRTLGAGFLEAVYQAALVEEFAAQNILFSSQVKLPVFYEGEVLEKYHVADFICYDKIVVEIKSATFISDPHEKQLINYLKATGKELGMLVNFGAKSLQYKRAVNSK
ncbi:GxxExxY protein [uncultured Acetobacteroides sp.]|uniref:GxxExxY protein n=1 Tax=uncultured Acetobacteroides sp. TaxID=1760811 RepID=UPI0029F5B25A|nr:GxxExxY protein [uncultured Acetobacteroides sp.]